MRVLLSWLKELLPGMTADAAEVARRLTMAGLEVEAVERLDRGLEDVVVAEVRVRDPVAGTHLSVCKVWDGREELQVVCGAQNYQAGDHVPLARVGAVLPDGRSIGRAKLRGIESFGMLCSARELGLSQDASGLLILGRDTQPGTPVAKATGRDDVAFEVNVTPNRADALSHLGIARDLAALLRTPVRAPEAAELPSVGTAPASVEIEAADGCHRYAGRVLEGVEVRPSPAWMQARLEALGQRPINNIVDCTNYVMFELGQPLHAFDLDRLAGHKIVVRRARADEPFRTLDGKDRVLSAEDLVIADAERPVAMAGVMGGEDSEVKANTHRLLLESAYFAPSTVRRTARRHGLHSESSHRFERGVDPEGIPLALDRLASLILETGGGRAVGGRIDVIAQPHRRARVKLRRARLDAVLGTPVPWEEACSALASLQLVQLEKNPEESLWEIPGHRGDISLEIDLIEEVARLRGFEKIPMRPQGGAGTQATQPPEREAEDRLHDALSAAGFDEAVNYSFVSRAELERFTPGVEPVALKNPLAAEQSVMRTTLLSGLARNLAHNLRHGVQSVRLYEVGRAYLPLQSASPSPEGAPTFRIAEEPRRLALVAQGPRARGWAAGKEAYDFHDLKGAVETVLEALGVAGATYEHAPATPWLHPRLAAVVKANGRELGRFGTLHPSVADALDVPRDTQIGELDLDALVECARLLPRYAGIPRFPASLRDFAVVVDETVQAADVLKEVRAADPQGLVEDALLFDVYRGAPLPEGRKNLAYSLRYRAPDRTLTDDEVNRLHDAIVARLRERFGAQLRA